MARVVLKLPAGSKTTRWEALTTSALWAPPPSRAFLTTVTSVSEGAASWT